MSPNRYVFIDKERDVHLITPSTVCNIVTDAPTLNDAIKALLEATPPKTIKGVFVLSYVNFNSCRRSVEALQKAGYNNIESIDLTSLARSSNIYKVPLQCVVGEVVFTVTGHEVFSLEHFIRPLRKCEKGWQILKQCFDPVNALVEHPSVRNVVFYKDAIASDKAELRQQFPRCKLHPSRMIHPDFKFTFVRNRINGGNLKGCEVLPFCCYNFLIKFGDQSEMISFAEQVPPFTITKEIYIGNVPSVKTYAYEYLQPEPTATLVRWFNFKGKGFRTVSITVSVDKTLLPTVTLKTIATSESAKVGVIQAISSIMQMYGMFVVTTQYRNQEPTMSFFPTLEGVISHLKKLPDASPVFYVYSEADDVGDVRSFRETCHKAGSSNVKFINYETISLSFVLSTAGVSVEAGKMLAVLYANVFLIIEKVEDRLRVCKTVGTSVAEVKDCKVDTYVVADLGNDFPKSILDELRETVPTQKLSVLTEEKKHNLTPFTSSLLWSVVDSEKTDLDGYMFNDVCDFDFNLKWESGTHKICTKWKEMPFTETVTVNLNSSTSLEVIVDRYEEVDVFKLVFPRGTSEVRVTIHVETLCDIKVNGIECLHTPAESAQNNVAQFACIIVFMAIFLYYFL
uniref:ATP-dependent DNA helicase n=1 Tax=Panagrellus redivivus TaxID=6233 RepID=A0A7E4ZYC0_PANRE